MLQYLKEEANLTRTENGAQTYVSTGSYCLDLFASAGALRNAQEQEITDRFAAAFAEDRTAAMKLLFFARDVRGGLGERRVFRILLEWLARHEPETLRKNLALIPEYGRFDDWLVLLGTACEQDVLRLIAAQLQKDLASQTGVSLLAKWLPSVNASNRQTVCMGRRIARYLGMTEAHYRRVLVQLREKLRILENGLRKRDYSFSYEQQPSGALLRYRKAFLRNDCDRYLQYLQQVRSGGAVMHTGTLTPCDIVAPLFDRRAAGQALSEEERRAMDTAWNAMQLPCPGENALAVVDGSGSMYSGGRPLPAAAALSLGVYFAERNTGAFHNHFITFSTHPRLVEIRGRDIAEKVRYCAGYNEVADTDLQAVFELILRAALRRRVPAEQLPARLYIISDMEFNQCARNADITNFECARQLYAQHGYALPEIVFWNVAARSRQQPVTKNEAGVALVSGFTPRLFAMVNAGALSPLAFMQEVLALPRYAPVAA